MHLSKSQNIEELNWLLCMFTACDPYMESTCPFRQDDYNRLIAFLLNPATWEEDSDLDDLDDNFIALDVEDRGFALGLPPGLYAILLPREGL